MSILSVKVADSLVGHEQRGSNAGQVSVKAASTTGYRVILGGAVDEI